MGVILVFLCIQLHILMCFALCAHFTLQRISFPVISTHFTVYVISKYDSKINVEYTIYISAR